MVKVYMDKLKEKFLFSELVEIIRVLRAPGGCPWDAEQTHKSIRNSFVEETYEAVDAIDNENDTDLCEELGDVLLQILLHSQIASEENSFNIDDVINGISKKMILRHPHVFGDVKVNNSGEVLNNWDKIKQAEKHQKNATQTLESVPMAYPALLRSAKVQKRAVKAGAEPIKTISAADEAIEILSSLKTNGKADFGRLLFLISSLANTVDVDCEEQLNRTTNTFIKRFSAADKNDSIKDVFQTGNR